jgi:hypothetical protein
MVELHVQGYQGAMADQKAPPTPRKTTRRKKVTDQDVAARAYEISQTDGGGSSDENWLRAEQELRGSAPVGPP